MRYRQQLTNTVPQRGRNAAGNTHAQNSIDLKTYGRRSTVQ